MQPIYHKASAASMQLKRQADSCYKTRQFEQAAILYTAFIKAEDGKMSANVWYDIACCYMKVNKADSALHYMQEVARRGYTAYAHLVADIDLLPLHKNPQWQAIVDQVSENRFRRMARPNREAVQCLDSVMIRDQGQRWELQEAGVKYGKNSAQYLALKTAILRNDSLNRLVVDRFLKKWGWLSNDEIGAEGGIALFLVIQHAPTAYQLAHYDAVKEAVANKYTHRFLLCYLDDRIAVDKGEPQIYGTQIGTYGQSDKNFVYPVTDIAHLDERRTAAGLESMANYVRDWNIHWSVEQYSRDLPATRKAVMQERIIKKR